MIRVVLDTNVVVSSNLRIDGISAAILDLAVRKKIRMYVSRTVMAEYKEVLNRPRFNLGPQRIARTLSVIRRVSALVKAGRTVVVSEDDPDNRLLECAQAALRRLSDHRKRPAFPKRFEGTEVVTPVEFLEQAFPGMAKRLRETN